jgi:hydroxymethylbilane synthase
MSPRLLLGTRASPLALAQARKVARRWKPRMAGSRQRRSSRGATTGDKVQDRPLAEIGGKALWTKELDRPAGGRRHCRVHSMKDVESERPPALCIAALLPRADVRDRLIGAASIDALSQGAKVGTSSPRRTAQLLRRRPDLQVVRSCAAMSRPGCKGRSGRGRRDLLAAAGLDRLGIDEGSRSRSSDLPARARPGRDRHRMPRGR